MSRIDCLRCGNEGCVMFSDPTGPGEHEVRRGLCPACHAATATDDWRARAARQHWWEYRKVNREGMLAYAWFPVLDWSETGDSVWPVRIEA